MYAGASSRVDYSGSVPEPYPINGISGNELIVVQYHRSHTLYSLMIPGTTCTPCVLMMVYTHRPDQCPVYGEYVLSLRTELCGRPCGVVVSGASLQQTINGARPIASAGNGTQCHKEPCHRLRAAALVHNMAGSSCEETRVMVALPASGDPGF
jgi:hypothetical protein